ncbi:MAG: ATP-binding protein, partial [bacterium]
ARTLRGELERQHPDLDELRKRIRRAEEEGEEWTADEAARVRAGERYRELNERIEELISEMREGEGTLRELESRTTLDRIEGEILHVREELERVRRRRDRLALLGGIVRVADHRFRDRNQPDVLRTAGRYLETITGGRYRRLLMQEGELSGTLYLEGPGYPQAVEVDTPISTGTREQVYLALRLAVIDHLDAGGERLPLVLDEAFVNWDVERRGRAFAVLGELARERQIFVFTCHEPMARELEGEGARLVRLDGPE